MSRYSRTTAFIQATMLPWTFWKAQMHTRQNIPQKKKLILKDIWRGSLLKSTFLARMKHF